MSKFWDQQHAPAGQAAPIVDEVAAQEFIDSIQQPQLESDVLEDEEADLQEVLSNANLRLEQGRLYQMIINHDIFENLDADPKAIRNVTREFRKFARERMEIMLGMRQPTAEAQAIVVSSPFNDLEVVALKTIAAQMSKGRTLSEGQAPAAQTAPKKDGITPLSGASKPLAPKPLPKSNLAPIQKPKAEAPAKTPAKTAAQTLEDSFLQKPIEQMTPEELVAYDQKALERRNKTKAALPAGYQGIPSNLELEALYAQRLSSSQSNPSSFAMALATGLQRK